MMIRPVFKAPSIVISQFSPLEPCIVLKTGSFPYFQPTHFSTSYFLKSGNQNPQQGVSSQDSSPQGSPSTRPKAARGSRTTSTTPSTAMVSHTSQEHTQQVTVSKSFSPTHVEPSSSSVKLANAKERAELERSHQETMEKLEE